MLTSHPRFNANKTAGFSLLEVLVVLAIMGLMLSVVSVRLVRTAESVQFTKTADAIISDVVILRAKAVLNDEARILVTDESRVQQLPKAQKKMARLFNLPEGWRAEGDDIFISRTGVCIGGAVTFEDETGRKINYDLQPPMCDRKDPQ